MKGFDRFIASTVAAALLTACTSGPRSVDLLVQGGAALNPTFDGKSSAVNIRIVPLIDAQAFTNASDQDLQAEPPVLAPGTWVAPHQDAVVYVGQRSWIPVVVKPEVRCLGVFGLFNESTGERRAIVPVGDLTDSKLVFDAFSIVTAPRGPEDAK